MSGWFFIIISGSLVDWFWFYNIIPGSLVDWFQFYNITPRSLVDWFQFYNIIPGSLVDWFQFYNIIPRSLVDWFWFFNIISGSLTGRLVLFFTVSAKFNQFASIKKGIFFVTKHPSTLSSPTFELSKCTMYIVYKVVWGQKYNNIALQFPFLFYFFRPSRPNTIDA